ncbi:hypothetical protein ACRQ5Q_14940 [Bradyrhizobium sp. PMVTL-01]|uniref:hypothetical protein n=1 Tax=Bradyrhizobium sp. PMVTL-01 TaxID=3434999 RepID=UPI003F714D57
MTPLAKSLLASILTVAAASGAAGQEGRPITEAMRPVMAAARIFALENHLHGDIAVADEEEGHIGERFEVNPVPGSRCDFTMRKRNGPVVETISFTKLSAEYKLSRRGDYVLMSIPGEPGAQCEVSGTRKACSSSLDMTLMVEGSPSELDLAKRAMAYIASVCPVAALPF